MCVSQSGMGIGVTHKGLAAGWQDIDQVLADVALPELDLWIACHSEVRFNKRIRLLMDLLALALRNPY